MKKKPLSANKCGILCLGSFLPAGWRLSKTVGAPPSHGEYCLAARESAIPQVDPVLCCGIRITLSETQHRAWEPASYPLPTLASPAKRFRQVERGVERDQNAVLSSDPKLFELR